MTDLSQVPFQALIGEMIKRLDPHPDREGMDRAPERVARALSYLTKGYGEDPKQVINGALFTEDYQEMITLKDLDFFSLCEHHILPFFGKAHVAYIPDGRIMGLSKAARLVELYSRRFQVQERLTEQIAQAVWDTLNPMGVGVVVEAYHLCMMMRGVEKQNSKTITSAMRGTFLRDQKTRDEFLRLSMTGHVLLS